MNGPHTPANSVIDMLQHLIDLVVSVPLELGYQGFYLDNGRNRSVQILKVLNSEDNSLERNTQEDKRILLRL